ncbi:hypothetical protein ABZP36_006459 [Zizania latifolia]
MQLHCAGGTGYFSRTKQTYGFGSPSRKFDIKGQIDIFGGFSNEQAESKVEMVKSSPAFFYTQLPEYSTEVGLSHHQPESTSRYPSDSGHSFQSINQRSVGTGQPPAGNKERDIQNPSRHQSFPSSGNISDTHQ